MRFPYAASAALAAALFLAACDSENGAIPTMDQSAASATPTATSTAPSPDASFGHFNRVVQVYYGIGSLALPCKGCTVPGPGTQRFLFDVDVHQDGTVQGGATYSADVEGGFVRTGTALCVANIGDGVWGLGFTLTHSTGIAPTGFPHLPVPTSTDDAFIFAFKDNDRGFQRSAPDEITGVIHTTAATVKALCGNPAAFGFTAAAVEAAFLNNLKAGVVEVIPQ